VDVDSGCETTVDGVEALVVHAQGDGAGLVEPGKVVGGAVADRHLHNGEVRRWIQEADPQDPDHLRRMLTAGVRRSGAPADSLDDFDMEVRTADTKELITTFAVLAA
jgi:hypothetical protein